MAKGDELQRVGRAVAARRGELGMTRQGLADAAGVDLKTVYNLESGTRWPIARTRAAIAAALGWEADALAAVAEGEAPAAGHEIPPAARGPQPGRLPEATPEMELAMEAHLARIRDRLEVARAAHPGGKLTGKMVFPRSPRDAESWDQLAGLGWAPEAVARGLAALLAWDEQESASGADPGVAAGLAAAEVT